MAKGDMVPADAAAPDADDEGPDPTDLAVPAKPSRPNKTPAKASVVPSGPPFFTIYKKGQGKWTRLGSVFAIGTLALLTTYNVYQYVLPYLPMDDGGHASNRARQILFVGCVALLAGLGLLIFWFGNKPRNVDFLIATDSEMKKVNWTTKGELFGSTRVVVLFLIFVAVFLFVVDLVFQQFFHLIRVLQ